MNSIDIKALRQKLNLTTQQLADRIGVTRFTINRWESGKSKPHNVFVKMLKKLEKEYDDGKCGNTSNSTKRRKVRSNNSD